jgi:hypothetical protein
MKQVKFKKGDRVTHINHGLGTVLDTDTDDPTSIIVEFDKEPKMWNDTELEVSITCLKKVG